MKCTVTRFGLSLLFVATLLFVQKSSAQKPMDDANEKAVQITQGPSITNISSNSATINWTTNANGANHVRYRVAGSNSGWKSAYHQGGGTSHSLQLAGLEPGKTYEWQILTRDGDLRTAGQFQTPASGTAPDVNAGSPSSGGGTTASGTKVPLYRSVSTTNSSHLYSTTANDQAQSYRQEGISGYLVTSQGSGTVPIFRVSSANDILLTLDPNERARFLTHGFQDNGVVGYVASSQVAGTQPFYRLVTPDGAHHFFTTSPDERNQLLGSGQWKDEGTAGYLWTQP